MPSRSTFDASKLRQQLTEIDKQAADPNLWSNPERSQQVMREKKRIEDGLATDAELTRRNGDIAAYFELAHEGEKVDGDLQREIGALQQGHRGRLLTRAPISRRRMGAIEFGM